MQQEKKKSLFLDRKYKDFYDIDFTKKSLLDHLTIILTDYNFINPKILSDPISINEFTCSSISLYLKILGSYISTLVEQNEKLSQNHSSYENSLKIQKNSLLIAKFSSTQLSIHKYSDHILKTNPSFVELLKLKITKEFYSTKMNKTNSEITFEALKYIDENAELSLKIPYALENNYFILININEIDSYRNQHIHQFIKILNQFKKKNSNLLKWLNFAKKIRSKKILQYLENKQQKREELLFKSLSEYINQHLLPPPLSKQKDKCSSSGEENLDLNKDLEEQFFGNVSNFNDKHCYNNTNSIINQTIHLVMAYQEHLIKKTKSKEQAPIDISSLPNTSSTTTLNPLTSPFVHASGLTNKTNSIFINEESPRKTKPFLKQFTHNRPSLANDNSPPKERINSIDNNRETEKEVTIFGILSTNTNIVNKPNF